MSKKQTTQVSDWVTPKGKVQYRSGARAPWFEFLVTMPSGEVVKLIAKRVTKFYSEEPETKKKEEVTL